MEDNQLTEKTIGVAIEVHKHKGSLAVEMGF
jgi:hypothetical protein